MKPVRQDARLAVVSLVLALIPTCFTQLIAFWLAAWVLRRASDPVSQAEPRGLAVAAQTCSVFMIPVTGMVAIMLAVLLVPWFQRTQVRSEESAVVEGLRLIHGAQTEWRRGDPDGDGVLEYSVAGIRPLHDTPGGDGNPIALIPRALAEADATDPGRPGALPYCGYWFRALAHDHEGIPYRSRASAAFGIVAHPAEKGVFVGRMFLLNETGAVWEHEYFPTPVEEWPARDPAVKGWRIVR